MVLKTALKSSLMNLENLRIGKTAINILFKRAVPFQRWKKPIRLKPGERLSVKSLVSR